MTADKPQPSISSLSVFFPAYNDGGTIASMVVTALQAARTVTDDLEILVIDDGSTDYTASLLDELAIRYPELRVIHHAGNQGYGATLRHGFSEARKEWVFYTDGDAQYNPLELVTLVKALDNGVDVVNGYKTVRHDPLIRILTGKIYHYMVKWTFGFHLRDVDCDFRLIRRRLFDEIELESTTGTICLEMVKKFQDAGYVFAEVPVSHYYRQYGISQFFNWRRLFLTGIHLVQLWWKLVVRKDRQHQKT
jgi:glycosyltransferase involved in cell wall biosynthesis